MHKWLSAPVPGLYTCGKTLTNVYKIRFRRDHFETCIFIVDFFSFQEFVVKYATHFLSLFINKHFMAHSNFEKGFCIRKNKKQKQSIDTTQTKPKTEILLNRC